MLQKMVKMTVEETAFLENYRRGFTVLVTAAVAFSGIVVFLDCFVTYARLSGTRVCGFMAGVGPSWFVCQYTHIQILQRTTRNPPVFTLSVASCSDWPVFFVRFYAAHIVSDRRFVHYIF